jgi:hypothetical protein
MPSCQLARPKKSLINFYAVIPSEAELPLLGNSAQSRDLVFSLAILRACFINRFWEGRGFSRAVKEPMNMRL